MDRAIKTLMVFGKASHSFDLAIPTVLANTTPAETHFMRTTPDTTTRNKQNRESLFFFFENETDSHDDLLHVRVHSFIFPRGRNSSAHPFMHTRGHDTIPTSSCSHLHLFLDPVSPPQTPGARRVLFSLRRIRVKARKSTQKEMPNPKKERKPHS